MYQVVISIFPASSNLQLAFGPTIWPFGAFTQTAVGEMAYKPLPSEYVQLIQFGLGILANYLGIRTKYGVRCGENSSQTTTNHYQSQRILNQLDCL